MIFFDTTKTGRSGHRSGLNRVSSRLREALGAAAVEVVWRDELRDAKTGRAVRLQSADWFLTSELFSEDERPGFGAFLAARAGHTAAIFHDAIPLRFPHITWPQSVARHPGYMKLLSRFARVWSVSDASRSNLLGFWLWQGVESIPPIEVLALGADIGPGPRSVASVPSAKPSLLCLGIIEPRKNQSFLLEVCAELWAEGLVFELHVVGRVNPHFGPPIVAALKRLRRTWRKQLHFHEAASDAVVAQLYRTATVSVFPTIAEGCGLPLLESLWMGVPCICSDLPSLRENAAGGGCILLPPNDRATWKATLRTAINDGRFLRPRAVEARTRPLPTWQAAAETLRAGLR